MKVKTILRDTLALVVVTCALVSVVYMVISAVPKDHKPEPMPSWRIQYLRDSLQMEWYRKQLDSTYPVDHSKIPVK